MLALVLLCAGATMWYLYRKGFSKSWREWLVDELRTRGVEVSFTKLIVEPFRGLVAKDVRIYQNASRKRVLAKVDEIVIEANYAHAARGEPFLNALTLVDASIDLPLDAKKPDGPAVRIEKLNTRLHLPPKQLLVARLEAEVFGVRVKAAGQLANPLFTKPSPPTPPGPSGESPLARAVEERYPGFDGFLIPGPAGEGEAISIQGPLRLSLPLHCLHKATCSSQPRTFAPACGTPPA